MYLRFTIILLSIFISTIAKANTIQNPPPQDTLKILSWNIHMLPYFVYYKSKKRIRARRILEEVKNSDYQILVFQEVFHRRVRKKLKRALKKKYPYQYGPANRKRFKLKTNSGIWVASDRPLIHLGDVQFDVATTYDNKLARKGAMMFEGEFNGHKFQLIGTHTQGNPIIINNHQFHQIYDGLMQPYYEEGIPQILCGDLNCSMDTPAEYESMLRVFDIDKKDVETMYDARYGKEDDIVEQTIDYIFVKKNNSNINIGKKRMVLIGPDWEQGDKKIYLKTVGLSDHYAIDISLTFE